MEQKRTQGKKVIFQMVLLLLFVFGSQVGAYTEFGFNYWPSQSSCFCLTDTNWTTSMKNEVKEDLDFMVSMGTGVLRLMFWPQDSGYKLYANGSGGYFTSDYDEIVANLPDLLGYCSDRSIKVVISFGNNYLNNGTGGSYWWQIAYGSTNDDFVDFLVDSESWLSGIVDAAEGSSYASTVLYYDFQNELHNNTTNVWWYLNFMYDWSSVPSGKRGISPQHPISNYSNAASNLGSRTIDFVEFHVYTQHCAGNDSYQSTYSSIPTYFSSATRVMGEYGSPGPNIYGNTSICLDLTPTETTQEAEVKSVTDWAVTNNVPYILYWMPYDLTPNANNQICASNYGHHEPKDVMGYFADKMGLVSNPDMELVTGSTPTSWGSGSTSSHIFCRATGGGGATNTAYARLKMTSATGSGWMSSCPMSVGGNKKVYLNSFIRASMDNVSMNIAEYNSSLQWIRNQIGPKFDPFDYGWVWNNYLHSAGSFSFTTHSNTRYILVTIGGDSTANPCYLDVDCVTVWQP